jgi:hypothetical protein
MTVLRIHMMVLMFYMTVLIFHTMLLIFHMTVLMFYIMVLMINMMTKALCGKKSQYVNEYHLTYDNKSVFTGQFKMKHPSL